ncbi:metallophosphoesterase family protein [Lyngbya confervoides]|uniref:Metallophosphoesterase n=1 Tax=Lyngbya confervoides BDU141951 TaxID=1574623 RepID=A0ABD4T5K3_9CYAN|nr:metallophosphoesterase [Lyngbya confervoides]MCM1983911.1 metallophosphoesterase [Lyngbya confervoides BDU141951]
MNRSQLMWLLSSLLLLGSRSTQPLTPAMPVLQLLTDPFLQLPTSNSVRVVWFTEFEGTQHLVQYGDQLHHQVRATTQMLSKVREDQRSQVGGPKINSQGDPPPVKRQIWRHEAVVPAPPDIRVPYRVVSQAATGQVVSDRFTLSALPTPGSPQKILLTSDHQLKPMTPANLQKVVETVGQVDAVFFAGDLVNIPDRASEWFDDRRGNAFFPTLQGRAHFKLGSTLYRGGAIIQSAPLFPAIGNHEVMGRFSKTLSLADQFNDAVPRAVAEKRYHQNVGGSSPGQGVPPQAWIQDHSFNVDTYRELFSLPTESPGQERYYALTFGDIRLISLYITHIWRPPGLGPQTKGRYRERESDLAHPNRWGHGQHIFEAIAPGSPQSEWLQQQLQHPAFRRAKYRVVMFHHPPHTLGDNGVPPYTDPVPTVKRDPDGTVKSVRYQYPPEADNLQHHLLPLLEEAGVDLVFYGHTHLWNRFISPKGMHFLETSNVGNTYGAYTATNGQRRQIPPEFEGHYAAVGDPNGLAPVVPTLRPPVDAHGQVQPYIASNDITVFSILETQTGAISSYQFDTRLPDSPVIKFDEFYLGRH